MQNMLRFLILISGLAACCYADNSNQSIYTLGGTYDSSSAHPTNIASCLKWGNDWLANTIINNPRASLNFNQVQNSEAVQNALGVDMNSQIDVGAFTVNIPYHYAKTVIDDSYTLNLSYVYKYAGTAGAKSSTQQQGEEVLENWAQEKLHSSPTEFRKMCGDGFVAEMDAGISIVFNVALKFQSSVEKDYFDSKFRSTKGLQNILNEIKTTVPNIHFIMEATGVQVGGKPEKFNQLFINNHGTISPEGYGILSCSNANCADMINQVIDYVQTTSDQLNNLSDYFYSNPTIGKWKTIGIDPGHTEVDENAFSAMRQITKQYYEDEDLLRFINYYTNMLSAKNLLLTSMADNLNLLKQTYSNILTEVYKNPAMQVSDCFNGYISTTCISIRDNVIAKRNALLNNEYLNALLDYLVNHQYMTKLMIDNRNTTNCLFSPISPAGVDLYMLNCDGQIAGTLNSSDGIKINIYKANFTISSFSYKYLKDNVGSTFSYSFPQPFLPHTNFPDSYNSTANINSSYGYLSREINFTKTNI